MPIESCRSLISALQCLNLVFSVYADGVANSDYHMNNTVEDKNVYAKPKYSLPAVMAVYTCFRRLS